MMTKKRYMCGIIVLAVIYLFIILGMYFSHQRSVYKYIDYEMYFQTILVDWLVLSLILFPVRKGSLRFLIPIPIFSHLVGMLSLIWGLSDLHGEAKGYIFLKNILEIDLGSAFELFLLSIPKGSCLVGPIIFLEYSLLFKKK